MWMSEEAGPFASSLAPASPAARASSTGTNSCVAAGRGSPAAVPHARDGSWCWQPGALDAAAHQPLAHEIDVQTVSQRNGRHRFTRLLTLGQKTCAVNSAPCMRLWNLGSIGAHLFELVVTIVTNPSATFKTGLLDAHAVHSAARDSR